jgi:hypothetical protein
MDKPKSRFQPLIPTKSSRRKVPISPVSQSSPKTPSTEINWSSRTIIKHPRIMEQASTITQWKLLFITPKDLCLENLQKLFPESEVKSGSLFIKGIQGITPAARIFSNGTLTCASCSHLSNIQRGNEVIETLNGKGYSFKVDYKGDRASTYNGNLFTNLNNSSIKRSKDITPKKRRKTNSPSEKSLRLEMLANAINRKTRWNVNFNPELQNCLTIALPRYMVKWSEKYHYKFSSNFNARVVTFLLCMNRLKMILDKNVLKTIISFMAKMEQYDQIGKGESQKQGSLRIFSSGSVTGLGIKNCELLQDVVEKIDEIVKENSDILLH